MRLGLTPHSQGHALQPPHKGSKGTKTPTQPDQQPQTTQGLITIRTHQRSKAHVGGRKLTCVFQNSPVKLKEERFALKK